MTPKKRPPLRRGPSPLLHGMAFFAIAAVGFYTLILPRLDDFASGGALDASEREARLTALNQDVAGEERLIADARSLPAADLSRLDVALPKNFSTPELIAAFDGLAAAAKLKLVSVSARTEREPARGASAVAGRREGLVNVILADVSYAALKDFLRATEQSLRFLDLTQLTFKPENSVTLVFKTYFYPL